MIVLSSCWYMRLSHQLIVLAGTWPQKEASSLLRLRNFLMQSPAILNTYSHCSGALLRALHTNRALQPFEAFASSGHRR